MNLMDAIRARRSVRAYTSEAIPRETIETLIAAATQAPTGMNAQPWAFGVVQGVENVKAWSDRTKAFLMAHIDEYTWLQRYRETFEDPTSNLCHGAPALVIIFGKPAGPTVQEDCTMAAYTIMLAAADMGLGTCWMGFTSFAFNTPEARAELGVPEEYKAIAPIIIGHPAEDRPKPERNAPEILFWQG